MTLLAVLFPIKVLWSWIPFAKIWKGFLRWELWLVALLKPLGVFGVIGLEMVDAAFLPLPFLDPLIVKYGADNHGQVLLVCFGAAIGSAIGSLVPYFVGRGGGELFLLKRIDRTRYERLRDRFAKQEFLAVMLPAMCPPPMPLKLFQLAAGVFEIRPVVYFLAIASGKFVRFLIESILVIVYGPTILQTTLRVLHQHLGIVLSVVGVLLLMLLLVVLRRVFDRKRGVALPVEDTAAIDVRPGDAV